ncbi:hypothetical protein Tco_1409005 [Tanacetum coccineum]
MAFPRLQELVAARNSNYLTDAMSVYIKRKINDDLHFAAGLSHLWETLGGREGESFWEGGDDFGVDVLRFYTCLTDILGFLEKLEWWFEQDIDKEEERFKGDEDDGEVWKLDD